MACRKGGDLTSGGGKRGCTSGEKKGSVQRVWKKQKYSGQKREGFLRGAFI